MKQNVFDWIENRLFTEKAIATFTIVIITAIISYAIVLLVRENIKLREKVQTLREEVEMNNTYFALPIICTVVNPVPSQTDSTPTITATMNRVTETTLAISRPLEKYLPMGTRILWAGDTTCQIDDRMNSRWKEFRIDRYSFTKTNYKEEGLVLIPLEWR